MAAGVALLVLVSAEGLLGTAESASDGPVVHRPELAVPEFLEPFLTYLEPGRDEFVAEAIAVELEGRLGELADVLRKDPDHAGAALERLLAPGFRGARLTAGGQAAGGGGPFVVFKENGSTDPSLDASAFAKAWRAYVAEFRAVSTAEFAITAIEPSTDGELVRTTVRHDLVGPGKREWRLERVGTWHLTWRRVDSAWRATEWTSGPQVTSRAMRPIFTEITGDAFRGSDTFARQFGAGLDAWMATLDSVLTRDSNGHHGVSVGDADGDGIEDLYIAQPAGLPNRLYRGRGDSTFEDVTERSGLDVLDDTAQSLFADVDNDGDQDLVLATGTQPLLFTNDGTGRFAIVPDAFRFRQPLQGSLTSIAMADYDRDGFLDLYLCVYSYFYGAGEDKAGTPMPYYDARNGPPGALFRNDGVGRFVEVTSEAGLDAGNDRYHFAAAWADYDGDGWQDLLVANDFGTKNLYRNLGLRDGRVMFEDVASRAGVLDHGAGMSATFFDYDNDGHLDIYTGNMWSASGLRVTASPQFMPDAPGDIRALYHRHARGNSLFRNRGDGGFDDRTLEAGANMGRWAWSSDVLDFDSDGWDDLYVVNGMLSREGGDLEGFFWRQVVARSPASTIKGTPYDDAWRSINQLLIHRSIASRQRNVFLRNDGSGGFDDVSGTVGLDLDQDGRSFAVLDLDGDGDPDLAVMAARQAPQLRVFRNDFSPRGAALAIRLRGTESNRDAVGARVTVVTDRLRRVRTVFAGSGFISQHSKELLIGLGPSERIVSLTVDWPSGRQDVFEDLRVDTRLRLVEGGTPEEERFAAAAPAPASGPTPQSRTDDGPTATGDLPLTSTWLYEPFPAPEFSLPDGDGVTRSLAALAGKPAVLLVCSPGGAASHAAIAALGRGRDELTRAGIGSVALVLEPVEDGGAGDAATEPAGVPVVRATEDVALSYAILNRHIFMNRQHLRLPTTFLLDGAGRVVKAYREAPDVSAIVRDAGTVEAPAAERLSRAVPFAGTLYSPPPQRNYLPYGRELLDQGLDAAAVVAFERAVQADPQPPTLYRLGTLLARTGESARARAVFERALALDPDLAEAYNDLGALLAREGNLEAAIERFRAALVATPEYPDALNNLGYALLLTGREREARALYEKALSLQPDFPEALNNLGMLLGRAGELDRARSHFREALERRSDYGEAANNLALVLVAQGQAPAAVALLEDFLQRAPAYESAYITLAKIHLSEGRTAEGLAVVERLLQRNPTHAAGLELVREYGRH